MRFQLIHMGREYPREPAVFTQRVHDAFMRNAAAADPDEVDQLVAKAEYVAKELEALYMLKKYRTMKNRYYSEDEEASKPAR